MSAAVAASIFAPSPAATGLSTATPSIVSTAAPEHHGFSFGDFLDIVNPLQHIPVVGTLYRAITGDKIDTPEKIAGDTLYGGVFGFISSVADTAFEAITGKNMGDTVLALFEGSGKARTDVASATPQPAGALPQTAIASAAPQNLILAPPGVSAPAMAGMLQATQPSKPLASPQPESPAAKSTAPTTAALPGADALTAALRNANIDPALAARAAFAYSRAVDLSQPLPADAMPDASALAF